MACIVQEYGPYRRQPVTVHQYDPPATQHQYAVDNIYRPQWHHSGANLPDHEVKYIYHHQQHWKYINPESECAHRPIELQLSSAHSECDGAAFQEPVLQDEPF